MNVENLAILIPGKFNFPLGCREELLVTLSSQQMNESHGARLPIYSSMLDQVVISPPNDVVMKLFPTVKVTDVDTGGKTSTYN
jgi:hypothetical protein